MSSVVCLCMIVKDEEKSLARCLRSTRGYVNDIVIVDTGSTDGTREVAESFNARVYDIKWRDDFAEARNLGLTKATGDWVLWLDADEELSVEDDLEFRAFLEDGNQSLAEIPMVHYYGAEPTDICRSHSSASCRLFRRNMGLRFVGRIHEGLDLREHPPPKRLEFLKILHYGYMEDEIVQRGKGERNLRLLLRERAMNPRNGWLYYHIACEYLRMGEYDEALQECNNAIVEFLRKGLLPPAIIYKLKYDTLVTAGVGGDVLSGLECAIALYPSYTDLHYYKGIILFSEKRYEEAAVVFRQCLDMGEENHGYLTLRGVGSFLALSHLEQCLIKGEDGSTSDR